MDAPQPPFGSSAVPGWRLRWLAWRNRLLASPRFQAVMARLPLTRPVARARATALFDLVAGFSYAQVLLATVESGLLEALAAAPVSPAALAAAAGLSEEAALRLLRAAAALDLAEPLGDGRWTLGQRGAALHGNPGAQAMIRHHKLLYADLADPLALLRQDRRVPTALSSFWAYGADAEGATPYSALMAASHAMVAEQALAAYDFARHTRLLDVGGGHGAFVSALAARGPRPELALFDLPGVVAGAAPRLAAAGLGARVALHGGDFFRDALPPGHDCITLVRILHDHDDAPAAALLAAAHAALPPGGALVIAEPMAGTPGAAAMGDAYFGFYLWAMNRGRPRSAAEYGAMLTAAGFAKWRRLRTPQPVIASAVVAFK